LYDVGANVGFFTLLASRLVGPTGRVVAFEPEPDNVQVLRHHVLRNSLANVSVIGAAVSDEEGVATLGGGGSTASLGGTSGVRVATVTIDGIRRSTAVPAPTVIKVDVEGWEYPALSGMRDTLASVRPTLLIEFHGAFRDGIDWDTKCRQLLADLDYGIIRLENGETVATPREHETSGRFEMAR
jgi:FkbM family methyltransferase